MNKKELARLHIVGRKVMKQNKKIDKKSILNQYKEKENSHYLSNGILSIKFNKLNIQESLPIEKLELSEGSYPFEKIDKYLKIGSKNKESQKTLKVKDLYTNLKTFKKDDLINIKDFGLSDDLNFIISPSQLFNLIDLLNTFNIETVTIKPVLLDDKHFYIYLENEFINALLTGVLS